MDKELLEALNNLSLSLDEISKALRAESTSAVSNALKGGDFTKSLESISKEIVRISKDTTQIKKDQAKIVTSQNTIIKMLSDIKSDRGSEVEKRASPPTTVKESEIVQISKDTTQIKGDQAKIVTSQDTIIKMISDAVQIKKDQAKIVTSQNTIIKMLSDIKSDRGSDKRTSPDQKIENKLSSPTTVKEVAKDKDKEKDQKIEKKLSSPTTVKEVAKDKDKDTKETESKSLFGGAQKDSSKIKDGVSTIILIAAGVLAIGMAFKIIGKIDIASVLSLSLALPLIAIAFQKISEIKLKPSEIGSLVLLTVGMSTAIALSSFILGMVQPIGIFQAITAILIAGVFSTISFGMTKLIKSIKDVGISGGAAIGVAFLLPILMVGFSAAIAGSSYFLGLVKPVGLFQGITAILISAVFVGLSYSLGKIVSSLKGINPVTALVAALVSPILLVALSAAIAGASIFLGEVKPVGLFQALTAILISAVFAALSYGINKIVTAFRGVGPATLIAAAIGAPIILIAMSYAIMKSSEFLGEVKPIGIFQALSAILVAAVFAVLSFGIKRMLQGFQGIGPATAIVASIALPILLIALSYAIKVSSEWLSEVKPLGFSQFFTAIGISIIFVALSFSVKPIMKGIQGVSYADVVKGVVVLLAITAAVVAGSYIIGEIKKIPFAQGMAFIGVAIALGVGVLITAAVLKGLNKIGKEKEYIEGGKSLLIIAAVVAASSLILSVGNYSNAPGFEWSMQTAISLAIFGAAVWALKKLKVGLGDVVVGSLSLIAIAGAIWATSHIISDGDYSKYPPMDWIIGTGLSLVAFGLIAGIIGAIPGGIGYVLVGLVAILGIAGTILATSYIIADGNYSKYPSMDWIKNVSLGIGIFALGAGGIGAIILGTAGLAAGALALGLAAIAGIAYGMVETDNILAGGNFSKYPSSEWVDGTSFAILKFAKMIFLIGGGDALGGLLSTITFGAFKDPLTAGIAAAELMSETMVNIDKIFAKSSFDKFPGLDWINSVIISLERFSTLVFVISKISGESIESGIKGVESISNAIVNSSKILANGVYGQGPSTTWAAGVSSALQAFSPIYKMLVAEKLMGIFGMGISTDQFVMSIDTISSGIVTVANKFALNKASFEVGPKKEWAEGMSIALGAFSPIYKMLVAQKLMDIFGMGISVGDYTTAIETISDGIIISAAKFQKNKASFEDGPKKEWAEGISIALQAFSPIYGFLMKENLMNYFLPGTGVDAKSYKNAIVTISQGIITAAHYFGSGEFEVDGKKIKSKGLWKNGPPKEWAEGVGLSLGAFAQVFEIISRQSGGWLAKIKGKGAGSDELSGAIITIAKAIVSAAGIFAGDGKTVIFDKDKAPTKEWSEGVKSSLEAFSKVFDFISGGSWFSSDPDPIKLKSSIILISDAIKKSSVILSLGKYDKIIDENWSGSTKNAIETFIGIFEKIEDKDLSDHLTEMVGSLEMISMSILKNSLILSKGSYTTIIDKNWITGIDKTISGFIDLMKKFKGFDTKNIEAGQKTVDSIINSLVEISKKFESISFTQNLPTDFWIESIRTSIEMVASLITNIGSMITQEQVNTGNYLITSILSTISTISKTFDGFEYTQNFPTDEWIGSLEKTISRLSILIFNIGMFDKNTVQNGSINSIRVLNTAVDMSRIIEGLIYPTLPKESWVDGIDYFIRKMGKLVNFIGTGYDSEILESGDEKIISILKTIKSIDKRISELIYSKPPEIDWTNGVEMTIYRFGAIIKLSESIYDIKILSSGRSKIMSILSTVIDIGRKISKMKFPKPPEDSWNLGVEKSIKVFGNLSNFIDNNFSIPQLLAGNIKINRVLGTISDVATKFAKLDFSKFPDAKWNSGVLVSSISIAILMKNINKLISLSGTMEGSEKIKLIASTIFYVDQFFSKMDRKKSIDSSWADPLSSIISTFSSSMLNLSTISDSDFAQGETNINKIADLASKIPTKFANVVMSEKTIASIGSMVNLLNSLSSIIKIQSDSKTGDPIANMSDSFDRLSKSIQSVGAAIGGLDMTKLQYLSSIKSSSILINLISEEQFQKLITQIESRNSQFTKTFDDRKAESPNVTTSQKSDIAGSDKQPVDNLGAILAALEDIRSVLGSGKTVDTYVKDKSSDFNLNTKGKR